MVVPVNLEKKYGTDLRRSKGVYVHISHLLNVCLSVSVRTRVNVRRSVPAIRGTGNSSSPDTPDILNQARSSTE